ncbi:MAG: bifunctional 5,10-methylene-tetrahydrofolate dehydrogenase/5,10-methylene-tetrahydrofolate cyclohydrolase, partial [Acidaminococcaceae bacterium]
MATLAHYEIALQGKNVVVLGRSNVVGKPVALLLLRENATVTICHSRTTNLPAVLRSADIIVAAVGIPGFIQPEMVKEGVVIVDVGINATA